MSTPESIKNDCYESQVIPKIHDLDCACISCHQNGDHDGYELGMAPKCDRCEEFAPELRVSVEMKFSYTQYREAREWEKRNKYHYDHITHLLLDWSLRENPTWIEI